MHHKDRNMQNTISKIAVLTSSIQVAAASGLYAADFVLNVPGTFTQTNGVAANVLDGDDTLSIGEGVTISTAGVSAVSATGGNNSITNRGTLTSDQDTVSLRGDSVFTNYGVIESDRNGIDIQGRGSATLINYGSITGRDYPVDFLNGPTVTIYNYGTIQNPQTTSARAVLDLNGDDSAGSRAYVYNSGLLSNGDVDQAVYFADFEEVTFINEGTLQRFGTPTNSQGVLEITDGDSFFLFRNSGQILAKGGGIALEYGADGRTDSHFLDGTVISGGINFHSNIGLSHFHFGAGVSGRYQFGQVTGGAIVTDVDSNPANLGSVNVENGVSIADGDFLYIADFSSQNVAARNMSTFVSQLAIPEDMSAEQWISTFGFASGSNVTETAGAHRTYGAGVRYGGVSNAGNGYYFGVALTKERGSNSVGFESESAGVLGGLYGGLSDLGSWSLDAGLFQSKTEQTTNEATFVSGLDRASDTYLSGFLSPSLSLDDVLGDGTSISARYAMIYKGTENYAFTNYSQRVGQTVSHFAEVKFEYERRVGKNTSLRFGAGANYLRGDTPKVELAGTSLTGNRVDSGLESFASVGMSYRKFFIDVDRASPGKLTASFGFNL